MLSLDGGSIYEGNVLGKKKQDKSKKRSVDWGRCTKNVQRPRGETSVLSIHIFQ